MKKKAQNSPPQSLWITAQQAEEFYGFNANTLLNGHRKMIRSALIGRRRLFLRADCEALHKEMLQTANRNRALRLGNIEEAVRLNSRAECAD
jgi:hypothetical protein